MSEDNENSFGGIKDKLIVWEAGNAVTGVTGGRLRNNDNVEEIVLSAPTQAMSISSIPIVASKNRIPFREHVYSYYECLVQQMELILIRK